MAPKTILILLLLSCHPHGRVPFPTFMVDARNPVCFQSPESSYSRNQRHFLSSPDIVCPSLSPYLLFKAMESFNLVFHLSTPKGKTLGKRLWRISEENLFCIDNHKQPKPWSKNKLLEGVLVRLNLQLTTPIDSNDWPAHIPQLITTFLIFYETWRSDWQHNQN